MITTNIADKYDKVFTDAFNILAEVYGTEEEDIDACPNMYWGACVAAGKMVNLDAYFISFGTLIENLGNNEIGPFVLLPLDEPPFEINANTREIKIPDVFRKGVAVQGDCGSEILVFTIDKYFDYVDLNNMDIWIQYTTSDKQEKAYRVDLLDRDSVPGKIRFGWVLGPDVTKQYGPLKFSVRFFKLDENNPNKAVYSLGTLPQTINIYPALQPEINETTDGYTNALFKNIVRNSLAAGVIPADAPRFDTEPAEDLPATASLVDDTLTLETLATVTDNGMISYDWHYSLDGIEYNSIADNDTYVINNTTGTKEVINPKPTNLIKYYTDISCDNEYVGDFVFETETILYKKVSTCTIKPATEETSPIITGFYRVQAYNTLTDSNKSNSVGSSICKLPGPDTLKVLTNLDFEKNSVVLEQEKEAKIEVVVKANPSAQVTCSWKYLAKNEEEPTEAFSESKMVGNTGDVIFVYTPTEEGYYYAEITSLLNRTNLETTEEDKADLTAETPKNAVRATLPPVPPEKDENAPEDFETLRADENGLYVIDSYINPIEIGHFTSDKQTYTWKYALSDVGSEEKVITKELSSFVEGPVDEKIIKIKKNTIPGAMTIRCEAFNTLNGANSAAVSSPIFILGF